MGFTESTLLDLVTEDGRSGFMVRLARHVDEGRAWVWLVTYGSEGVHGFVDDRLPCTRERTVDPGSGVTYAVELPAACGTAAWIRRAGPADAVSGGSCVVDVLGHATQAVPRGPGPVPMRLEANFASRTRRVGSNLPGRTESIVEVEAVATVAGVRRSLRGLGQFHEQLQDAPRFDTPFTYTSLRGRQRSLVGLRGPKAGRAVLQDEAETVAHLGFEIAPLDRLDPRAPRRLRIADPDGRGAVVRGEVSATVTYSVPIHEGRRPSAIVTGHLDGDPVTGFVNDWTP